MFTHRPHTMLHTWVRPLHTQAKGWDHEFMRAFVSHSKAVWWAPMTLLSFNWSGFSYRNPYTLFIHFFGPLDLHLRVWGELGRSPPFLPMTYLRASLHYGGEVHRPVKKFSPRHGFLRQRMVRRRRWEDKWIILFKLEFSRGQVSCLWLNLRLPKKLDLRRTPLLKSVRHIGIHVIFSSMYNVLHQRTLGRSVNHHRTRVLLSANQILEFP